jgi:uncharacterized protein (TIRG00374 family)
MTAQKKSAINRLFWNTLKFSFGISIIAWLVISGKFELDVYAHLYEKSQLWLLLTAFLVQAASTTLILSRWWRLANVQGLSLPLGTVLLVGYRGIFASLLLPGSIGLDGMRAVYLKQHHDSLMTEGLASIVVDRALGLLGLMAIAFFASIFYWWKFQSDFMANIIIAEIFVLALILLPILLSATAPGARHFARLEKFYLISRFIAAAGVYRRHPSIVVYALGISIVGHLMTCFAWYLAMQALDDPPLASMIVVITPILLILRTLPLTPMGLGVTDGAAESLYSQLGIGIGAESQMLMRFINIIILVISGLAFFCRLKPGKH